MEANILNNIKEIKGSLMNTFKFQVIYNLKVSKKQEEDTLKLLKKYRKENKNQDYLKELFPS